MKIDVRPEQERDYRRVEEITKLAFLGNRSFPLEHWMVHELRKRDGFSELSFVAEGYGAILFFGRPEYYPQFGFVEAAEFDITDLNGDNSPAFMAMELIPGYLAPVRGGKYYESDIYDDDLNFERAKLFDEQFMRSE